jgi:hypothetical protein
MIGEQWGHRVRILESGSNNDAWLAMKVNEDERTDRKKM